MSQQKLLQLRDALLVMANLYDFGEHPEWFDPDFGICSNAKEAMRHFMPDDDANPWLYLQEAFKVMGLDKTYPVPHPVWGAQQAFDFGTLWSGDEYGDNRRALCRSLVAYIEAELAHKDAKFDPPIWRRHNIRGFKHE